MAKMKRDRMLLVPTKFWQTMGVEEVRKIAFDQDGWLNAEQCARLWRMQDRQGKPPQRLQLLIDRAQLERAFPPPKKEQR